MDSNEKLQQPHAVLVSGPGFGHVNGCLLLAKSLLSAGFSVTMACFARAYSTHASKGRLTLPDHPRLRLEVVPDGLSPLASSYHDLFLTNPAMFDGLLNLLHKLAHQQHPATCLISDTIMAWPTQDVADQLGIPRVDYWTATATSYLIVLSLPDLLSKGLVGCHKGPKPAGWKSKSPVFLDCVPGLPAGFPLDEVPWEFRFAGPDQSFIFTPFLSAVERAKRADCVLIHSVHDLEKEPFDVLQHAAGIQNVYAIGPLVQNQYDEANSAEHPRDATLTWLDSRPPSSVIYVAFGSHVRLTAHEISELALGLEASGRAFLWVIRSDATEERHELHDVLPRGFHERTAEQGLIVPWVSQLAVLNHRAVGGFLSHCGWNSTLESLWMGVPILASPRRAEQPINFRFIVKEWGTGIELETSDEGTFSRTHVEKGVRTLLDEELGHVARVKARELSHVLRKAATRGGHSHSNLQKLASRMKERCLL